MKSKIKQIYDLLLEIASGNYSKRGRITKERNELDGIITGINMLAEELEASTITNEHLKSIFEGIVDPLIICNLKGQIKTINSSVTNLLGYKAEDLTTRSVNCLFQDKKKTSIGVLRKNMNEGSRYSYQDKITTIKGDQIPVSCSFSYIKKQNKNKEILLVMKDITPQIEIQNQLKSRNTELNTFIYRASHDLKGPIASMVGLINLAEKDINDLESSKLYIQMISSSIHKLDGTIGELLDLGRISMDEVVFDKINVQNELNEVIDSIKNLKEFGQVKITVNNKQQKPFHSERRIFKSIIQNLIENSIKYRKTNVSKSFVKVNITDNHNGINIVIKDNGQGIPEEIHSKVFNMFYRGNPKSQGSGLGLYIVKTGVEKLGGSIKMRSSTKNGTTIEIFLKDQKF